MPGLYDDLTLSIWKKARDPGAVEHDKSGGHEMIKMPERAVGQGLDPLGQVHGFPTLKRKIHVKLSRLDQVFRNLFWIAVV